MAKVQFSNASEIFTLQKQGVKVPGNVVAAARNTLAGKGTPADASVIRNYIGIQHSGAKSLKRSVGGLREMQKGLGDIEVAAELYDNAAQRGQNPFPAGIRLAQVITDKTQDFLKTKLVKNLAVSVGKYIGSDARASKALLLGLRRVAGFAGSALSAVGIGVDIGSRVGLGLFDASARRNASAGRSFDVARQNSINIAAFGLQSRQLRQDVVADRSLYEKIRDAIGFDEGTTAEQEKRIEQRGKNIKQARGLTGPLGSNATALLVQAARGKGKTVDELTEREAAEALDRANRFSTDSSYLVRSTRDKDMTEAEQFDDPDGGHVDDVDPRVLTKLALKPSAYRVWFNSLDAARRKIEYEKIAEEEVIPEKLGGIEIRQADARIAAENTRAALFNTPEKKAAFREQVRLSEANFQAEYSRRKVVEYD